MLHKYLLRMVKRKERGSQQNTATFKDKVSMFLTEKKTYRKKGVSILRTLRDRVHFSSCFMKSAMLAQITSVFAPLF